MTLRFVDADTFTGEILIRDKEGMTVFEMASLMKRTTEKVAIDETTQAGPLPPEMAVLDRLVGDWHTTGVIKDAEAPAGLKASWQSSSRKILGGRLIAQRITQATDHPRYRDAFTLSTFDSFSKAYGRWLFQADGSVLEYGGGWDEKTQTMKWHWAGKDGSQSTNTWKLRDADRRDTHILTKDAVGKTTFELQATSVRQSEPGWVQLWSGKDLNAWTDQSPKSNGWKIEGGILEATGKGSILLSKRTDFGDFHLRMELMSNADTRATLGLRSDGLGKDYRMELAIARTLHTPGSIRRDFPVARSRSAADGLVEPGEWFTLEVIAKGDHFIVKQNGKIALDWTDDKWVEERGAIALLQSTGCGLLKIRKFEIKPLATPVIAEPGVLDFAEIRSADEKRFDAWIAQMKKDGFRPTHLSVQTVMDAPRYTAVAVKEVKVMPWEFTRAKIDDDKHLDEMRGKDFVAVAQCLYREDKNLRQAFLWAAIPNASNDGILSGSKETVDKRIDEARKRKARPIFRSAFEGATVVYDVVLSGPTNIPWMETLDQRQADCKAWIEKHQALGWRPDHLYAFGSGGKARFGCILIQEANGPDWEMSWALTATQYEQELAARRAQGFRPNVVVAHETAAGPQRYSVIWTRYRVAGG
ncbi:MAG: DUF1080 domain-containing protein, partial [Planctomycetes bacterium]|nr:DUF1080 domain-containing protein [Planctomycetota bacterium]